MILTFRAKHIAFILDRVLRPIGEPLSLVRDRAALAIRGMEPDDFVQIEISGDSIVTIYLQIGYLTEREASRITEEMKYDHDGFSGLSTQLGVLAYGGDAEAFETVSRIIAIDAQRDIVHDDTIAAGFAYANQ